MHCPSEYFHMAVLVIPVTIHVPVVDMINTDNMHIKRIDMLEY